MDRVRSIVERAAGIDRIVAILVLNPRAASEDPIVLDSPPAGTVLVREIGNRRGQRIEHLVVALGLPIAGVLGIVGAGTGTVTAGLQHVAVRAVRANKVDAETVIQLPGVIAAMLHALDGGHRRIAVPIQAEPHSLGVRVIAGRKDPRGPVERIADGRVRPVCRVALPPVDVQDDFLKAERRGRVDQGIVVDLGRIPTALALAGRRERVPFHLGIAGIVPDESGQRVAEQVFMHAVRGIVHVALVGAEEGRWHLERLARRQVGLEIVPAAGAQPQPAAFRQARDRHPP